MHGYALKQFHYLYDLEKKIGINCTQVKTLKGRDYFYLP